MSIDAIGAIGGPIPPISTVGIDAASATSGGGGGSFATQLMQGLEHVEALQTKADGLSVQAATGQLTDVHDYMIASTEAALATQLTVAVRNKAVEAFNEIMRMQA
jgi:flagellar hook-basal body complex protein FliE